MPISPTMQAALQTAILNWHRATRAFEAQSRLFADAEAQLQLAQRDLHELARAIEVATGEQLADPIASAAIASTAIAPAGSVTMPVVPGGGVVAPHPPPAADGLDAAAIVLAEMQRGQLGAP